MKRKRGRNHDDDGVAATIGKRRRQRSSHGQSQGLLAAQHSILDLYYPNVYTLGSVLRDWLPSTSRLRQRRLQQFNAKSHHYSKFLNETLVSFCTRPSSQVETARRDELIAFTQTQRATQGNSNEQRPCDLKEIIDFAIWSLFRQDTTGAGGPDHLLCHGFRRTTTLNEHDQRQYHLRLPGIAQWTQNANVEALQQQSWVDVIGVLGKDAEGIMLNLLLDCSIFQQLNSGAHNLYQLSGKPLSRLTCLSATELQKAKSESETSTAVPEAKTNTITFVRNRMYYARPSVNHQGKVQFGLKHVHALNRYNDLQDASQDTRIMQYVFPRQFGLHNVFTSQVNRQETAQPLKDYTMREQEITALGETKIPKIPRRLRGAALMLIRTLRKNHQRCSYSQLLRHYCPVQLSSTQLGPIDLRNPPASSTSTLEFRTQLQPQSSSSPTFSLVEPQSTTSFLPYSSPIPQVVAFCRAVLIQVFPRNLFGEGQDGRQNWGIILAAVEQFIAIRRFESITLHEVCQSIKLKCITWLCPPSLAHNARICTSDRAKRLQILQELVYYIFDSLVVPIIRSNFYVTESGLHRSRLFYFRHDVWKTLLDPTMSMMRLSMFEPLNSRQLNRQTLSNSLGYGKMRFLPKDHGVRPIVNLKRRTVRMVNGKPVLAKSINSKLTPISSILNSERHKQPERSASAMFSVSDIHHKLQDFKARLGQFSGCYYLAKVDIRSCFDTIPQEELLAFVNQILVEEEYEISSHVEMKKLPSIAGSTMGQTRNKFVSRAGPAGQLPLLSPQIAAELANHKRQIVFVGTDRQQNLTVSHVRRTLTEHLQHNVVKVGHKHFRKLQGIPQGSVLSSLLCNLFYGDFERQVLRFLDPDKSLLLRLTDDFLLITVDKTQAKQFVHAMAQGDPQYGISVNTGKSLVNFEMSADGHKIPRLHGTDEFPYCGLTISTSDLQLRKDRRPKDIYVANGLSVVRSGQVKSVLYSKTLASLRRQWHAMLLDKSLNSRPQILSSIFECFVESGMKMHRYVMELPRAKRPTQAHQIGLCKQLVTSGYKMLQRIRVSEPVVVTRSQMRWLASVGLLNVFIRKQSENLPLLDWLRHVEKQSRQSMNMSTCELERMVEEGMKSFVAYVY